MYCHRLGGPLLRALFMLRPLQLALQELLMEVATNRLLVQLFTALPPAIHPFYGFRYWRSRAGRWIR